MSRIQFQIPKKFILMRIRSRHVIFFMILESNNEKETIIVPIKNKILTIF